MITDAASIEPGTVVNADVCIVGTGPAGIAIARRLAGSGLDVVMLESGGLLVHADQQRLNDGDVVGHAYRPLNSARFRSFGGSANRWGGWCRPLDPIDFEPRSWVPLSGWPIDFAEMARFHAATNEFLLLPPSAFDDHDVIPTAPEARAGGFQTAVYRISPLKRAMSEGYLAEMASSPRIRVITNATVTDLRLDPGTSRVGWVEVRRHDAALWTARASWFVLAAGGIENPRLLLSAVRDRPAGLGNHHDLVGRFFMEHVHAPVGHLMTESADLLQPAFTGLGDGRTGMACCALVGSEDAQRDEQLLPLSVTLTRAPHQAQPWSRHFPPEVDASVQRTLRRLFPKSPRLVLDDEKAGESAGALRAAVNMVRQGTSSATFARSQHNLVHAAKRAGLSSPQVRALYVRGDQVPNRESRVRLGDRVDRFGLRRPQLDWRLTAQDLDNVDAWMSRLAGAMGKRSRSHVVLDNEWRAHVVGGPHHMGTTRMSADPRHGVVDADCRVHSVENLFVAGSSVFPTGGYANPTYPLIALALRLADHLRTRAAS